MLVMCDVDGCVADVRELISHYLPDWKEYFRHQRECLPITSGATLIRGLACIGSEIIFATGRPESTRQDTEWWLKTYVASIYKMLLMRPHGFVGSTQDLKLQWLRKYLPDLIVEDDPTMVALANASGFKVLQVHGYRWSGVRDYSPDELISNNVSQIRRQL